MLEEILRKIFGCKRVFLKKKQICGYWIGGGEAEPDYQYLTKSGGKAYGKLTDLLYSLEELLGDDFDANRWVEELDNIVSENEY